MWWSWSIGYDDGDKLVDVKVAVAAGKGCDSPTLSCMIGWPQPPRMNSVCGA